MNSNNFNNEIENSIGKGSWSIIERNKFKESLYLFSKNWKNIQEYIKTRSVEQCKSHSQKYFKSLKTKFLKDFYKSRINSSNLNSYAEKWVNDLIEIDYMDLINKLKVKNENYVSKYKIKMLQTLISYSILGIKEKKASNYRKCCGCSNGKKRECDCDFACCKYLSELETENSSTYLNKKIFEIQKFDKSSSSNSYNSSKNNLIKKDVINNIDSNNTSINIFKLNGFGDDNKLSNASKSSSMSASVSYHPTQDYKKSFEFDSLDIDKMFENNCENIINKNEASYPTFTLQIGDNLNNESSILNYLLPIKNEFLHEYNENDSVL